MASFRDDYQSQTETLLSDAELPPSATWTSTFRPNGLNTTSWTTASSWRVPGLSPLQQVLDLSRFGAALLITSECDPAAWRKGAPFENGPKLQIPGGKLSERSQALLREQSLIGVDIMEHALSEAGVPADRIKRLDFCNGCARNMDPLIDIPNFWREHLNSFKQVSDALIYYVGPSVETGAWALTWINDHYEAKVSLVEPDSILPPPGPQDGLPGTRFVISDAPSSASMWLRPARRLRGVAAWWGAAPPGGAGGPPLTRWLAGFLPLPPEGAEAFLELPPYTGLEDLPCHKTLFWGPLPPSNPVISRHLLWELTEFLGSITMRIHRTLANKEILIKGGPQILLKILETQVTGNEPLALQVLWLLQALVADSPTDRWARTMDEAVAAALTLPDRLCGGYENVGDYPKLLAAILALLGSSCARCPLCLEGIAFGGTGQNWPRVLKLSLAALSSVSGAAACTDPTADIPATHLAECSAAARAACQLVSQAASYRPLSRADHVELFTMLLSTVCYATSQGAGQDLTRFAAEALLYATVRCNECKLEVLRLLREGLEQPFACALNQLTMLRAIDKFLSLVRSLASAEPKSAVSDGFSHGCLQDGIVDAVVNCLSRESQDAAVQRWGLAALGSLSMADDKFAQRAGDYGACSCVLWALGADTLSSGKYVEQEGLFCAYSFLGTEICREEFKKSRRLPGLTAGAIDRGLRREGGSCEAALWGLRIYGKICRKDPFTVEPFVGTIVNAMLAEGCLHGTMVAGSFVVSHLANVCPTARSKLLSSRVQLFKALQAMAHDAAAEGTPDGRAREHELLDWVQVLIDIIGPPRPHRDEDELLEDELLEDEDGEEVGSKAESKSRTGTKLNSGSPASAGAPKSGSKSRSGTKLDSGATRTKSKPS
eukprot:TRINITY_DN20757_c0_g1_i1.p1 TRINITY_DN20757_c0_g1~~TRINITY_DN20757_c0_g1_i1.p1  ORF type:complete len:891 (+),score=108.09 TRINITY_DN20757_c0_g1_i1:149-2821(+)